jgi:hypothetical protein
MARAKAVPGPADGTDVEGRLAIAGAILVREGTRPSVASVGIAGQAQALDVIKKTLPCIVGQGLAVVGIKCTLIVPFPALFIIVFASRQRGQQTLQFL